MKKSGIPSKRIFLLFSIMLFILITPFISASSFGYNYLGKSNNIILGNGNITANIYHNIIDWINVPISLTLTGTTACTRLNNLVLGYNYSCLICEDALLGNSINCGTIASVVENCACRSS